MQPIDFNEHQQLRQGRAPEWAGARRVLAEHYPPDAVERALLHAFSQRHRPMPWYRRWSAQALLPFGGLAAVSCMVLMLVAGVRSSQQGQPVPTRLAEAPALAQDFLPLAEAGRIAGAANAQLMRAEVPRHVLVSMGVPINEDAPDELVQAEMLVAASGEPLAIRLALN